MNGVEAAKAQAEYAPNQSNSTGLEMPSRDCCEGLPVVVDSPDAGDYVHPPLESAGTRKVMYTAVVPLVPRKMDDQSFLPTSPAERKAIPLCTGLLDYFPDALAAVAACSRVGNDQHNPGEPLHWARGKSTDQADCIVRHLIERGKIDADGVRHSAKVAWRALALLQLEIEADRNTSK